MLKISLLRTTPSIEQYYSKQTLKHPHQKLSLTLRIEWKPSIQRKYEQSFTNLYYQSIIPLTYIRIKFYFRSFICEREICNHATIWQWKDSKHLMHYELYYQNSFQQQFHRILSLILYSLSSILYAVFLLFYSPYFLILSYEMREWEGGGGGVYIEFQE